MSAPASHLSWSWRSCHKQQRTSQLGCIEAVTIAEQMQGHGSAGPILVCPGSVSEKADHIVGRCRNAVIHARITRHECTGSPALRSLWRGVDGVEALGKVEGSGSGMHGLIMKLYWDHVLLQRKPCMNAVDHECKQLQTRDDAGKPRRRGDVRSPIHTADHSLVLGEACPVAQRGRWEIWKRQAQKH